MSSSILFKAGVLALACASTASATLQYELTDDYSGSNFLNGFNFQTVSSGPANLINDFSNNQAGK